MIDWLRIQLNLCWTVLGILLGIGIGRACLGNPRTVGGVCLPALSNCFIMAAKSPGQDRAYQPASAGAE